MAEEIQKAVKSGGEKSGNTYLNSESTSRR